MDFETAYCLDNTLWDNKDQDPVARKLIKIQGVDFPIEDPHNLCAFLTIEESQALKLNRVCHTEWLDLLDPADMDKFSQIWQRTTEGWYFVFGEEHFSEQGRFLKLLRYIEMYYTIPPDMAAQLMAR